MPWIDALYPWLIDSALVSLAVLAAGSGAVLLCRQPIRRVRIIELTLLGCLVAPWLGLIPGYPHLSLAPRTAAVPQARDVPLPPPLERIAVPPASNHVLLPLPHILPGASDVPPVREPVRSIFPWRLSSWIVAGYLLGVAVGAVWWLVGVMGLARIIGTAQPAPPQCRALLAEIAGRRAARVRLLISGRLAQPVAAAWGRPVILLPKNLCGNEQHDSPLPPGEGQGVRAHDEQSLRWSLAHEWAHLERHDFRAWAGRPGSGAVLLSAAGVVAAPSVAALPGLRGRRTSRPADIITGRLCRVSHRPGHDRIAPASNRRPGHGRSQVGTLQEGRHAR